MVNILMLGVGSLLFLMALLLAHKLVRVVADLVIVAAILSGFWVIYLSLQKGDLTGWRDVLLRTPLFGLVMGLLTAPVLPFTSWNQSPSQTRPPRKESRKP